VAAGIGREAGITVSTERFAPRRAPNAPREGKLGFHPLKPPYNIVETLDL